MSKLSDDLIHMDLCYDCDQADYENKDRLVAKARDLEARLEAAEQRLLLHEIAEQDKPILDGLATSERVELLERLEAAECDAKAVRQEVALVNRELAAASVKLDQVREYCVNRVADWMENSPAIDAERVLVILDSNKEGK